MNDDTSRQQNGAQNKPSLDDDTRDAAVGGTRRMPPPNPQRGQQLPPPSGHPGRRPQAGQPSQGPPQYRQPPPQGKSPGEYPPRQGQPPPPARKGRARARRDSGLYLPLWSLVLMLMFVMGAVGGIVLVILSMGGAEPEPTAPIIIVSSPMPTERPADFPVLPSTATIPPEAVPNLAGNAQPSGPLALSGPALPTVAISPTPQILRVGADVIVIDVGAQQLNVRDNPGVTGTNVIFRAEEGSIFSVIDGPLQADGLTWWRIQDPNNLSIAGWAASNYLQPTTITQP